MWSSCLEGPLTYPWHSPNKDCQQVFPRPFSSLFLMLVCPYHVLKYEEKLIVLTDDFLEFHDGRVPQFTKTPDLPQIDAFFPAMKLPLHLLHRYLLHHASQNRKDDPYMKRYAMELTWLLQHCSNFGRAVLCRVNSVCTVDKHPQAMGSISYGFICPPIQGLPHRPIRPIPNPFYDLEPVAQ